MEKAAKLHPALAGSLILVVCQALTFYVAFQVQRFLEVSQIVPPQVSLKLPLLYFFVMVLLLGVILFLIPVSKLRLVFRIIFALIYSWGVFVALALSLPVPAAVTISIAGGLTWLFKPRIWLHNLLLIFTLVGVGSVFGFLFSPWTFLSFMLVVSIYDIVAVRFGYMLWLARKLSESEVLPAFVIPRKSYNWNLDLKGGGFKNVMESESGEREFSILGGDIGFPLMLVISVFSTYGFADSLVVAAEYLKEHIELQVNFAGQQVELLHISRLSVPEVDSREHLARLWNTDRWLKKTEVDIHPVVYGKKEGEEITPKLRGIRQQNHLLFESLKEHTRGKIRWEAFDEWQTGWDDCLDALRQLRSDIRLKINEKMESEGTSGSLASFFGEQAKPRMEEEMVRLVWRSLVDRYFGQISGGFDNIEISRRFAGYLTGDDTGEPVIPADYPGMVKSAVMDIVTSLVKDSGSIKLIRQLNQGLENISKAYLELEEKLNPMVLRPLLLSTRCRLCPV